MTIIYIGKNRYRARWFKSPVFGTIKFMLDVFIGPAYINCVEEDLPGSMIDSDIAHYANNRISQIEQYN